MAYTESRTDPMVNLYKKIKGDLGLKKRFVEENPELALRLYSVFGDRDIGLLFVGRYSNTREYGDSALFIADELSGKLDSEERGVIEARDPLPKPRKHQLTLSELI